MNEFDIGSLFVYTKKTRQEWFKLISALNLKLIAWSITIHRLLSHQPDLKYPATQNMFNDKNIQKRKMAKRSPTFKPLMFHKLFQLGLGLKTLSIKFFRCDGIWTHNMLQPGKLTEAVCSQIQLKVTNKNKFK